MNNFKVEAYINANDFYKNLLYEENSIHVVATSALSMHLKSSKNFKDHKNHIWTYANIQKAIYTQWYKAINQIKMKAEIRSALDEICEDKKIYDNLIKDINSILNDYKFYILSGIRQLYPSEEINSTVKMIRKAFNIFSKSSLVKEIFYKYEVFTTQEIIMRMNNYYESVWRKKGHDKLKDIWCIKTIYFYNLTYIDATRFKFLKKLRDLGIQIVFRIPYEGFLTPWEKTYSFIEKDNWKIYKGKCVTNKYVSYLKGTYIEDADKNKNIRFKEYVDPYEFKLQLKQYPLFQDNEQLIKWNKKHTYTGIEFKKCREYITFSKDLYNNIFNGTILNYKDKQKNFFCFNKGKFLKGLYDCKWDEEKKELLINYDAYINCILSGWIEIKTKNNIISGENATDLLLDLKSYMNGVTTINEIINRLYKVSYLQEFSDVFYDLSKEKTVGDKIKEYLHNPLKTLSYSDNNRYKITIKQLIELSKKLKRYLEDLIPKNNKINLQEHKSKLIRYWKEISCVPQIYSEKISMLELIENAKKSNDIKFGEIKDKYREFSSKYIQYLFFENKLKKSDYVDKLYTIDETKDYMKITLNIGSNYEEDSEIENFNYIKVFDQIEGIMINGTKEIYVTDLSEKSLSKYIKRFNKTLNYSDYYNLYNDLKSIENIYTNEEINTIINQINISKEQGVNFIKYYIGALLSFSSANIEFSWIRGINKYDLESSIYRVLLNLYKNDKNKERKLYFDNSNKLMSQYNEISHKLNKNDNENNLDISFHEDIAPPAWIDLDLCPRKFFYSGILNFYPVYENEFHQRIVFSVLGKLFKSKFSDSNDVNKYFYYLFPQWNVTMKDNFVDTSYKKSIRKEYKFKNIYFPYHVKDIQILRSKIYDNAKRKRRDAYRKMDINSERYMKEFIRDYVKSDNVIAIKGHYCYMCPYNMICSKGEFPIERSNY